MLIGVAAAGLFGLRRVLVARSRVAERRRAGLPGPPAQHVCDRLIDEVASERSNGVRLGRRGLLSRRFDMEADAGDARVCLEISGAEITQNDGSSEVYATVTARVAFALGLGFEFDISPAGTAAALFEGLGAKGAQLGDAGFDRCFWISSASTRLLRQLWTAPARELMLKCFPHGSCRSDGAVITLQVKLTNPTVKQCHALIDIMGELGSVDLLGLTTLAQLPDATVRPARGRWDARTALAVEVRAPSPVTLTMVARDGEAITVATASLTEDRGQPSVVIGDDGTVTATAWSLPPEALALLKKCGPGMLELAGDKVVFSFASNETDRERLLAAAQLLAQQSRVSLGVFR